MSEKGREGEIKGIINLPVSSNSRKSFSVNTLESLRFSLAVSLFKLLHGRLKEANELRKETNKRVDTHPPTHSHSLALLHCIIDKRKLETNLEAGEKWETLKEVK